MRVLVFFMTVLLLSNTQAYALETQIDGTTVEVPVCGGFPGLACGEKEWCDFPAEAACGAGDHFGTCRPRPEICTKEYLPVCGCDGKTYGNACEAAAAGFDVAYAGTCRISK